MWWLLVASALANKWEGHDADVMRRQVVPLSREEVQRILGDWKGWERLLPCASEWELQERTAGVDARARALYTIGPLRRRLVGVIRKDEPGLVTTIELEGEKGWITQITFGDAPEGMTEVVLHTPLNAPKWPVTGIFFTKVRPAWEQCYDELLAGLGR